MGFLANLLLQKDEDKPEQLKEKFKAVREDLTNPVEKAGRAIAPTVARAFENKTRLADLLKETKPALPVINQKIEKGETLSRSDLRNLGVDEKTNAQQRKVITQAIKRTRIQSPGIDIYGPQDVITSQDKAITEGPGMQFTKGIATGYERQTQIPALVGRKVPKATTQAGRIGEMVGATTELITELIGVGAALRGLGVAGRGVVGAAKVAGLEFGIQRATEEARKGIAEHLYDDDYDYKGGQAVLESMALGAALSLGVSATKAAAGAIWAKLKPSEQARALKLLGLKKGATLEEINEAYRPLARKYAPDKVKGMREQFEKVIDARDLLRNELRTAAENPNIIKRGVKPVRRGRLLPGQVEEAAQTPPGAPTPAVQPRTAEISPTTPTEAVVPSETVKRPIPATRVSQKMIEQTEGEPNRRAIKSKIEGEAEFYEEKQVNLSSIKGDNAPDVKAELAVSEKGAIILDKQGNVIDGRNRVAKARQEKKETILALVPKERQPAKPAKTSG